MDAVPAKVALFRLRLKSWRLLMRPLAAEGSSDSVRTESCAWSGNLVIRTSSCFFFDMLPMPFFRYQYRFLTNDIISVFPRVSCNEMWLAEASIISEGGLS